MFNDSTKTVEELLAPMLKKTPFVAISRVAEHLACMNALEAEGPLGLRPVRRGGRPRRGRHDSPVHQHNRRGAPSHGSGTAHQARATHLRAQKMGAARGLNRYLVVRVGQPVCNRRHSRARVGSELASVLTFSHPLVKINILRSRSGGDENAVHFGAFWVRAGRCHWWRRHSVYWCSR
jgi:hypothetical protein